MDFRFQVIRFDALRRNLCDELSQSKNLSPLRSPALKCWAFATYIISGLSVLSCAPSYSPPSVKTQDNAPQSAAAGPAVNAAAKLASGKQELKLLTSLNQSYCQRLQKLRTDCAHASGLLPVADDPMVSCEGALKPAAKKWTLSSGSSVPIKLVAHGGLYETEYVEGNNTPITWKRLKASAERSPQILELSDLIVKTRDDKDVDLSRISLKVDETEILNINDLVSTKRAKLFSFNLIKLKEILDSGTCTVSETEMNKLRQESQADSLKADAKDKYGNELNQVLLALEQFRLRKTSLEVALSGKVSLGCWASVKLEKFEILIEGSHLDDKNAGNSNNPASNEGSPDTYSFRFGESIALAHPSESTISVFRPGGRLQSDDLRDFELSQLQLIQIKREGVAFQSTQQTVSEFLGSSTIFVNQETSRTRLVSLKLKVGNEIIYENNNINHNFEKGSLIWQDKNIFLNPTYQRLFQRTDCPTVK